jgi:hypothetical protein
VPRQQANPAIGAALEAATRAIEAFCRRPLVLADYDRTYRPGRTRRIYLDAWPVAGAPTLSYDLMVAATVWNTDYVGNQQASLSMTPASSGSGQAATLTLRRTSSGAVADSVFTLAQYATIGDLLDAISAVGNGWKVVSPGYASTPNYQDILRLPTSRLLFAAGWFGALNQQVELRVYADEVTNYILDPRKGVIELTENRPEAFRYGDRSFAQGWGWAWTGAAMPLNADVRCQYRAGYAIAQANLALGYDPPPQDLVAATAITAQAILAGSPLAGMVQSQSVGGRSYSLKGEASLVPKEARPFLLNYMNWRIGGWGA